MLRHFTRLSKLTLAVAFLYVWLLSNGGKFIRAGLRHLVDRKDRRDLSLFQIGLRLLDRKLLNSLTCFTFLMCLSLKLSGGYSFSKAKKYRQ